MDRNYVAEISEIIEHDAKMYEMLCQCPYEILRKFKICSFAANQFILNQGEVYKNMYIVLEGELDIYVESEQGKKYYLNTYRSGNYIGELEMFGRKPYISTVVAKTEIRMLEIAGEDFIHWLQLDQNMNRYFTRTLCESTYVLCSNMGNNTLYTLKQRICQYLLDGVSKEQMNASEIRIVMKTESLGERMAVTQRSVNRILKQLKDDGMIQIFKTYVIINDYARLLLEREK